MKARLLLHNTAVWTRRSWITLAVLGAALLSAQRVLAADNGQTTDFGQTVLGVIGGVIASTIINLINQRHNLKVATKAENTEKKVETLTRELGVDDPGKATPDITKMHTEIVELQTKLTAVQNELTVTLKERDDANLKRDEAYEQVRAQVDLKAQDNLIAQNTIDRLQKQSDEQNALIASQEATISEYEQRFHRYDLNLARLEGRLDEREKQEQLVSSIKSMTDSFLQVIGRLMPAQPEVTAP